MRARRRAWVAAVTVAALAAARPARADCVGPLSTQLIPLPVYATLPNEGDTWGAMPVFLRVCPDDGRTESIIAPSVSWNSVIHFTGTFRWFHYPTDDTSLTVIASASTRINYDLFVQWLRSPTAAGASTDDLSLRIERSAFFRFFGLGPDTPEEAQSSYTGMRVVASARRGVNLARHLNLGASLSFEHHEVEAMGVPGLPLSPPGVESG